MKPLLHPLMLLALVLWPTLASAAGTVQVVTSRSGISAWLMEDHSLPLISLRFAIEGGAALDPEGKEGLSRLLASMLDEGAGDLDSRAFQSALSELAISLGFSADEDAVFGHLKALSPEKDNALALLRLALHQPRFDADALARMKDALVTERQLSLSDANWLASQGFEQVAMVGHPYSRPAGGTMASLANLTREDLVAAATERLVRSRLKVVVYGDITPTELANALDNVFGDLPEGAASVSLPELAIAAPGQVALIERDQPQTVLLMGAPGLKRTDPDWFAALIANYVLGGDFQSRLMQEIRIKRGLTYGVSSALVPSKAGGVLYAMASADNAKVAELVEQVRAEFKRLAMGSITPAELADARNYLTNSFALRFDSSSSITNVMLDTYRLGFKPDYLETRASEIAAVTEGDIARVAERLFAPENLAIVAVGRPEGLLPTQTLTIAP